MSMKLNRGNLQKARPARLQLAGRLVQRKDGPLVSPATVNKELRTLRAIVRKATSGDT